jgi:hypothetical protein
MMHMLWGYDLFQVAKDYREPGCGSDARRRRLRNAYFILAYPGYTDALRARWHGWDRHPEGVGL